MLTSQLLSSSADLQGVQQGARVIQAQETSDSVALIQEALVALGGSLPVAGIDDNFGAETGAAVSELKRSRGISPSDPKVGVRTIERLDFELSYLEGAATDAHLADTRLKARDPLFAGVLDLKFPDLDITRELIDFFELGDRLCFRMSFVLGPDAASVVGRGIEPYVFADFCRLQGPCTTADFFDRAGSRDYVDFLLAQHPTLDPVAIGGLGREKRPDILRHRGAASEWYEIKPMSLSGAIEARIKEHEIPRSYTRVGLPYLPGNRYTPTERIPLRTFYTPEGENLRIVLHLMRPARGLIFWEICVEGDWVRYFNRVRLTAGMLAILIAMADVLIPAAAAGGTAAAVAEAVAAAAEAVATLRALAAGLGAVLPTLLAN